MYPKKSNRLYKPIKTAVLEKKEQLNYLFHKYLQGDYSPEELDMLLAYFGLEEESAYLRMRIEHEFNQQADLSVFDGDIAEVHRTTQHYLQKHISPVSKLRAYFRIAVGVAAMMTLAFTAYYYIDLKEHTSQTLPTTTTLNDIEPGTNRASLTLADGRVVALSEAQEGIVINAGGVLYQDGSGVLNKDGSIKEQGLDSGSTLSTNLYVLTTPNGGTYQVTLPDGSRVWLNAGSTLKYPPTFDRDERVVELTGEAYFEVARSEESTNLPFRVVTQGQSIEVLGTQFNVAAYANDVKIKTTLVEGSVRVRNTGNNKVIALAPGEQAVSVGGTLSKQRVDVKDAIAWRTGKFSFNNKSFQEIMDDLARWYNLEVIYTHGIPKDELVGDAFRNQNLSFVLRVLDALDIRYQLDAHSRKLTIHGKNQ